MAKVLLHVSDGLRRLVETDGVYYLEADGGDTVLHRSRARPLRDIRRLGEIQAVWKKHGFVRIHRNHSVNPARILEIRLRESGRDWELKLAPPVNRILPISRTYLKHLWSAFGQSR